MNVKSIVPNVVPLDSNTRSESAKEVKTQESADRDPNGRREPDDDNAERDLNDEEVREVLESIKALPAVVENGFTVRLIENQHAQMILIETVTGEIVRRIPKSEFWTLHNKDKERPTGHIYDKAT